MISLALLLVPRPVKCDRYSLPPEPTPVPYRPPGLPPYLPIQWTGSMKISCFFMFYFIFNELVFLCLLPLCVLVTGFMQLKHISSHIVGRAIVQPARSMNAARWSRLWSQFSQLALPCNIICISRDCMFGMFANTVDCWLLRHHRYTLIDSLWGSADTRVG